MVFATERIKELNKQYGVTVNNLVRRGDLDEIEKKLKRYKESGESQKDHHGST